MVQYHTVTWYSKLLSLIFFVVVLPAWTFYVGMRVKETEQYYDANTSSDTNLVNLLTVKEIKQQPANIETGNAILEGRAYGMVHDIYEQGGVLFAHVDPADQVSPLECVFRAYDENVSRSCESEGGSVVWNTSSTTISIPLSAKATVAVYYNDGTKIGIKPKTTSSKNGPLYTYSLIAPSASGPTSSTAADLASSYNQILSYDGDGSYRWNPLMYIDMKKGAASLGEDPSKSYITSIEEVWRP